MPALDDAGEDGDEHAFAEIEFGDGGLLLFGGEFAFFRHAGGAGER